MGITDDIGDAVFSRGQLDDAEKLGDPGITTTTNEFSPNWDPAFKKPIHGLILVAGDTQVTVNSKISQIEVILRVGEHDATIHEVLRIVGDVRPPPEDGHEQCVESLVCSPRPLLTKVSIASVSKTESLIRLSEASI